MSTETTMRNALDALEGLRSRSERYRETGGLSRPTVNASQAAHDRAELVALCDFFVAELGRQRGRFLLELDEARAAHGE